MKDTLYARPHDDLVDFVFNEQVAHVFADMISRSVPGYATVVSVAGVLAQHYAQPNSRLYDLGCSLGAATLSMYHAIDPQQHQLIAVDNAWSMVQKAQSILHKEGAREGLAWVCADLRDISVCEASVVLLNYTLQFIPVQDRMPLLRKIYQGMQPGGVLMLSEKICFPDPSQQQLNTELHHAFKRSHGYSELEISQKRAALEQVLLPEAIDTHLQRLREVGFASAQVWFQCFNFASFIALK